MLGGEEKLDVMHYTTHRHIVVVFSSHSISTNESKQAEVFSLLVLRCFFFLLSGERERETEKEEEKKKKNVGKKGIFSKFSLNLFNERERERERV